MVKKLLFFEILEITILFVYGGTYYNNISFLFIHALMLVLDLHSTSFDLLFHNM